MADIEIRAAQPADIPGILEVHQKASMAIYPNPRLDITAGIVQAHFEDPELLRQRKQMYVERLRSPTEAVFVAIGEMGVVGYSSAGVEKLSSRLEENRFRALYVCPEHQGEGIGKRLLWPVLAWLPEGEVVLDTVKYTRAASDFHARMGFLPTGREWSTPLLGGAAWLPQVEMFLGPTTRQNTQDRLTRYHLRNGLPFPAVTKLNLPKTG